MGRARGELFQQIRAAASLVALSALVCPDMLVEIEAEAFLGEG